MNKRVRVVIPAAGMAVATWPATIHPTASGSVAVAGRPAVYWMIKQLREYGYHNFVVVCPQGQSPLVDMVRCLFEGVIELSFVEADRPLGPGYSARLGMVGLGDNDPVLVVLADTLFSCPLIAEPPADASVVLVHGVEESSRWCIAESAGREVRSLSDKPNTDAPGQALIGAYWLHRAGPFMEAVDEYTASARQPIEISAGLAPYIDRHELQAHRAETWYDVGHQDGYIEAQQAFLQARAFNRLTLDVRRGTIRKTSDNPAKFRDEIRYYQELPETLTTLFPRLVSADLGEKPTAEMEYWGLPTLADLLVFDRLPAFRWRRLFERLTEVLDDMAQHRPDAPMGKTNFLVQKNFERWQQVEAAPPFAQETLAALQRVNGRRVIPWDQVWERSEPVFRRLAAKDQSCVIHGDLCFSNILCDPLRLIYKLIDPRGSYDARGVFGDQRYDVAKLSHSALGLYDFIVSDLFRIKASGATAAELQLSPPEHLGPIQDAFRQTFFARWDEEDIRFLEAWLFLSMIPLHYDKVDRQRAFLLRGLDILTETGV